MFETDQIERALIETGIAVDPASVRGRWSTTLDHVFEEAGLTRPRDGYMQSGGRSGRHSEHLGFILTELQYLQRSLSRSEMVTRPPPRPIRASRLRAPGQPRNPWSIRKFRC